MKFGGFGGGMNMQQMMKQAQKLQEEAMKAQEELANTEVEGISGGGMVRVTISGKKKMLGIAINKNAVDTDDIEMLEDLIVAAYNDAFERAEELEKETSPLGGLF
ncbi:MAG: YbaB/EbfC family nucleoid-associated protein [Firmicutes bacterium]|nr:YbaB/EbfC family nucleoid-associated protein [Bacillota bacterium]